MNNKNKTIPIFFATDDNYIPFLDVTLASLIKNASREYNYDIHILNTGLQFGNMFKIRLRQRPNVKITFNNISESIADISKQFKNIYHFSLATYYRLFIESLFPEYSKILYLDCDIVVLGDISKLWEIDLEDNMVGGVVEGFIAKTEEFRKYAQYAVGVNPDKYINAGILSINLDLFRKNKVQDRFTELLSTYNFDTIDPDQCYLNYLCNGKIKYLENGWNFTSAYEKPEGELNIVHYALAKKPWQFDGVVNENYFWEYAKQSSFYRTIVNMKKNMTAEAKQKKEQAGIDILNRALEIVMQGKTFCSCNLVGAFC
ncbi:MAG: glycosyltransferase family 8 protein [Clostridia bacterium]|nr:glycosyltransferase family 8 protein [Clostridia bacterium]